MIRYLLVPVCYCFFLAACHTVVGRDSRLDDPFASQHIAKNALQTTHYLPSPSCFAPNWQTLTLAQSIQAGLCQHPETRAAYADLEKQAAGWGEAQSAYLPTLSVTYRKEATHRKTTFKNDIPVTRQQQHPDLWMAELQWVLFDFGERAARKEQSSQFVKLAAATYNRQLQQRFRNIATHYINLDIEQRRMKVAEQNMDIAQSSLQSAQALHDEGVAIGADVSQAQVEYDGARLQYLKAERDKDNAAAALLESMGYPARTNLNITALPEKHFTLQQAEHIEALLDKTIHAHPEIKEAQAKLLATKAQSQAIERAGAPQIFLYGKSQHQFGLRSGNVAYRERENSIGLGIRWPLFEGYQRHYQLRALLAQQKQEEALLEALKSRLSLEVRQAFRQLKTAVEQKKIAQHSVDAALLNYQTRLGRYREGVGGLAELLQAQRTLNDMRLAQSDAVRDWHHAALQLIFSTGQTISDYQENKLVF